MPLPPLATLPPYALGAWLLAPPHDTVVAQILARDAGTWAEVMDVLRVLLTLALLALVIALVPAALALRRAAQKASTLVDRVSADVVPLTTRARGVVESAEHVAALVRAEADRASAFVARAEARAERTLAGVEARVRDLEALVEVAQREAERTLVAAASTVAGVRGGIAALRHEVAGAVLGAEPHGLTGAEPPGGAALEHDYEPLDEPGPDSASAPDARPRVRGRGA